MCIQYLWLYNIYEKKVSASASPLNTGTIVSCWVHLVNDGITVNEESVTIEWHGTGPAANVNPPLPFQCRLDGDTIFQPCMFSRVY